MVNNEATEEFLKELDLTEEEIESYTGCSERTQRCLTDCPWPFPGAYINEANKTKNRIAYPDMIACAVSFLEEKDVHNHFRSKPNMQFTLYILLSWKEDKPKDVRTDSIQRVGNCFFKRRKA